MSKQGFLERFNVQMVAGWVPASTKGEPVRIEFNGYNSVTVEADIDREDTGVGSYGFACGFPAELMNKGNIKVSVYYNDEEIANSPQQIVTDESELQKVLYGKNDWLFLTNDTNESLGYLTGHRVADENVISQWTDLISQRNAFCSDYGIKCYHLIVPEKEVVYRDNLPDDLVISPDRPVIKLLDALDSAGVEGVVYPDYDECENKESDELVYSKGDTHWTHIGAYFAVEKLSELMASDNVGVQLLPVGVYAFKPAFQASDLLIKTTLSNVELIKYTAPVSRKIRQTYHNGTHNTNRRIEFINLDAPKVRLMCWHTSSVDWMMPFLNDMFGSVCYIWGQPIDWKEVLRYRPDVLLVQSNERFLIRVPNDVDLE